VTPWRRLRQARHLRPLKDLGAGNLDPLAGGPRGHGVTRRAMNGTSPPDFAAALSLRQAGQELQLHHRNRLNDRLVDLMESGA
jgi:hypothetical protein